MNWEGSCSCVIDALNGRLKKMTQGIDQDRHWTLRDWKKVSDDCKLSVTADVITNTQKIKDQDRQRKKEIKNKRRINKEEKYNINNEQKHKGSLKANGNGGKEVRERKKQSVKDKNGKKKQ